jgi:hypothetical protein
MCWQGVHSIFEGVPDREWRPDEKRCCKMVFIGRELSRDDFTEAFKSCLVCVHGRIHVLAGHATVTWSSMHNDCVLAAGDQGAGGSSSSS